MKLPFKSALAAALLALALAPATLHADMNSTKPASAPRAQQDQQTRRIEPVYSVSVGLNGEIFPVFANFASFQHPRDRKWPTVSVTIANAGDAPLRNRISVQVPGWSDAEIQLAELAAGETRTFLFAPSFYSRLYDNREIRAASAVVTATDLGGRLAYQSTMPVRLRSVSDMMWGTNFKYAQFIASWVTPHDPNVERVLARAKEFMPGRRLPGYETWKPVAAQERTTMNQAKAIYTALQKMGVSYVKSSSTLGTGENAGWSERVRMPHESLAQQSANCIDGVVMYASMFENLGMDPVIVVVPGHAYVGVRLADRSNRWVYIETSVIGRKPFAEAVKIAHEGIGRYDGVPAKVLRIGINQARRAGIYPMPLHAPEKEVARKK